MSFRDWKLRHLKECKESLIKLEVLLKKVKNQKTKQAADNRRILRGMKRDLSYAVEWLELGYEPPAKTDISRYSKRRRELLIDDFSRIHFENDDLTNPWPGNEEDFREYWSDYMRLYGGD
ncbi:hypothetical protein NYE37_03835 [Thermoactinomyces sp. FSL K6-2592]|jgi:hypothetical protein|uniref:hypothetical protein n=1 Tax=Thermoactinomyces sp. FSL K6-2592 TaxID=2975347 RepID=UPI0030FA5A3C